MKKKLLMLVAAFGLATSTWAMAPLAETVSPVAQAEGGYVLIRGGWDYMGWQRGTIVYDMAMAFTQGALAAAGGLAGSSFGPIGIVVGAGLGGL